MCATNRALNDEIRDPKAKAKVRWCTLKRYLLKKMRISSLLQQNLRELKMRLLNNMTSKLDHVITTDKSFGDHSDIGYKGESSDTKTVFVNACLLANSVDVSYNKLIVKSVATESKSVVQ